MAFKFKVAYTKDDDKIQPAIDAGTLDAGDLVIKDNDDGTFTTRFLDQDAAILKQTSVSDEDITDRIIPVTDELYAKKGEADGIEDGTILNGGSDLGITEVVSTVSSATELAAALADASVTSITLAGDITDLTEGYTLKNRDLTIDLAGYTIANSGDIWSDSCVSLFQIANGTLTITGDGTIMPKENDCYALTVRDNGTIVIESGTIGGNITSVYLHGEDSALYINGGTFSIQQLNDNNVESSYGLMINVKNKYRDSAYVEITGGTFEHYNPAEPEEGDMVYLADGYTTVHDETADTYTVVKEG